MIAIILLLVSILAPVLGSVRGRGDRLRCQSNLRQCYQQLVTYCTEFGYFPSNNWANCTNFRKPVRDLLDMQMRKTGIMPFMFYCPSLAKTDAGRVPEKWDQAADPTYNEVNIGYVYLGNPTNSYKYAGHYEGTINMAHRASDVTERYVLMADICSASRSYQQPIADLVPTAGWFSFPHDGNDRRQVCNILTASGTVKTRKPIDMSMNWEYDAPSDLYW